MDVRNRLQINSQLIHARGLCVLWARSTPESGMRRGRDERGGGPAGGTRAQQVAPSSRERHQLPGLLRLEPPGSWTALQEGGCLRKRSAPPQHPPPRVGAGVGVGGTSLGPLFQLPASGRITN